MFLRDVVIRKNNKAMTGMCLEKGNALWIKSGALFKRIPDDFIIDDISGGMFAEIKRDFVVNSNPVPGDKIIWFTRGEEIKYFPLARTVETLMYSTGDEPFIVADREGVKTLIPIKKSVIFVKIKA